MLLGMEHMRYTDVYVIHTLAHSNDQRLAKNPASMHISDARNASPSVPKCCTAPSVLLKLLMYPPCLPLAACFRGEATLQSEDLLSQRFCLWKSLAVIHHRIPLSEPKWTRDDGKEEACVHLSPWLW